MRWNEATNTLELSRTDLEHFGMNSDDLDGELWLHQLTVAPAMQKPENVRLTWWTGDGEVVIYEARIVDRYQTGARPVQEKRGGA